MVEGHHDVRESPGPGEPRNPFHGEVDVGSRVERPRAEGAEEDNFGRAVASKDIDGLAGRLPCSLRGGAGFGLFLFEPAAPGFGVAGNGGLGHAHIILRHKSRTARS